MYDFEAVNFFNVLIIILIILFIIYMIFKDLGLFKSQYHESKNRASNIIEEFLFDIYQAHSQENQKKHGRKSAYDNFDNFDDCDNTNTILGYQKKNINANNGKRNIFQM